MIPPLEKYPEVQQILEELLRSAQEILGRQFVGMYLFGSLTTGAFDHDSDIDVLVVTEEDVTGDEFAVLQAMHPRIARLDPWWGMQLEVSYVPRRSIRRYNPSHPLHPHIDRGPDEMLSWKAHDESWVVQRWMLRERGILLAGPDLQSLIEAVTPADLRRAMQGQLNGWAAHILKEPEQMKYRGYQTYTVLSICRILYTLRHGAVASKPAAARWAQEALDPRWRTLIEHTWEGRSNPGQEASSADVEGTLDFIRYAFERSRHVSSS